MWRSSRNGLRAGAEVEDSHPHREAVGYLIENHTPGTVGQLAVNYDAAVNRTRMYDQTTGFEELGALPGQTKERGIFAETRKILLPLALMLDAQEIDHIRPGQNRIQIV